MWLNIKKIETLWPTKWGVGDKMVSKRAKKVDNLIEIKGHQIVRRDACDPGSCNGGGGLIDFYCIDD